MFRSVVSLAIVVTAVGCSSSGSTSSPSSGNLPDSGASDAAVDGSVAANVLPFTPSNVNISGLDLSQIADEDVAGSCQIRGSGASDCFSHAAFATLTLSDQSKVAVYVVKSLKIEPTAHVFLSGLTGNLPIILVAVGDVSVLGTIDGHAQDIHGVGGGFESLSNQDGFGPGGGPKGSDTTGGGGGSYCGQGGQGNVAFGANGTPGPKTAASGTSEIAPLHGGASGGGAGGQGGAGGAGFQIVAGGTFTMSSGSYINVGGGGGGFGATAGGGGAGGSLLIEASTVKIAGTIAANGGGGGGAGAGLDSGKNGSADATPAAGGPGATPGAAGSAGVSIDGASAAAATVNGGGASGGGGGAGRVRLNSTNGQADLTGAMFSPALTTPCVTQGVLK